MKNLHKKVRSYALNKIPKLHIKAGFVEFCLWEIAKDSENQNNAWFMDKQINRNKARQPTSWLTYERGN